MTRPPRGCATRSQRRCGQPTIAGGSGSELSEPQLRHDTLGGLVEVVHQPHDQVVERDHADNSIGVDDRHPPKRVRCRGSAVTAFSSASASTQTTPVLITLSTRASSGVRRASARTTRSRSVMTPNWAVGLQDDDWRQRSLSSIATAGRVDRCVDRKSDRRFQSCTSRRPSWPERVHDAERPDRGRRHDLWDLRLVEGSGARRPRCELAHLV